MKQNNIITILFTLVIMFTMQTASAQRKQASRRDADLDAAIKLAGKGYLDRNYKLTKSLGGIQLGDDNLIPITPPKSSGKAVLEVISFGAAGNTILIDWEISEGTERLNKTYSWSGSDVHLVPSYEGGTGSFVVMRGRTVCGGLVKNNGKWILIIRAGDAERTVSNLRRGMTPAEVESVFSDLGGSQFKYTADSGNMKVYSLLWFRNVKRYNPSRTDYKYALRNDEKYADFYFDAQGKLVKWIMF